jgi:hypothetical protein
LSDTTSQQSPISPSNPLSPSSPSAHFCTLSHGGGNPLSARGGPLAVSERWNAKRLPFSGVVTTGKSSDSTTARPSRPSGQRNTVRGYRNPSRQVFTTSTELRSTPGKLW